MEQTVCSKMSAYKIQTPGNYPDKNIQQKDIFLYLSLVLYWTCDLKGFHLLSCVFTQYCWCGIILQLFFCDTLRKHCWWTRIVQLNAFHKCAGTICNPCYKRRKCLLQPLNCQCLKHSHGTGKHYPQTEFVFVFFCAQGHLSILMAGTVSIE